MSIEVVGMIGTRGESRATDATVHVSTAAEVSPSTSPASRGFEPMADAEEHGRSLIPLLREGAAAREERGGV